MLETSTIIAIASCAVVLAIVISVQLANVHRIVTQIRDNVVALRTPDRTLLGQRLAAEQRQLPEIVEVARPVPAAPEPIIWGGTLQQAEAFRRSLNLRGTQCTVIGDGSVRSIEGRRVHIVFLVGTAGQSPDGYKVREVLTRSGMKSSSAGVLFIDFRALRLLSDA